MTTFRSGRIDARGLSMTTDGPGGPVVSGGAEATAALMRDAHPTIRDTVASVLGRGRVGEIAAGISGGGPKDKAYRTVQRNLERWANGTRRPTLKTAEKYQAQYAQRTGKSNAALDKLIDLINGKITPGEGLGEGTLNIEVHGKIRVRSGKKEKEDVRDRAVTIDISTKKRRVFQAALDDPLAAWLSEFNDVIEMDLLNVDWIELTFSPAKG